MRFLTGNNFKSICNYYLDEFGYGCIRMPSANETVKFFVKTDYIHTFFKIYKPDVPYVLITHNSDFHITDLLSTYANDKLMITWYGQNIDTIHPKIKSIPIGIANEKWKHGNVDTLEKIISEKNTKKNLIYANFNVNTNYRERSNCVKQLAKYNINLSPTVSFETYLSELSKSYFVVSPNGNGVDCHKNWESFYLKTIPIVTKSINADFYKNLPIIILNSWEDFDPQNLTLELYDKLMSNYSEKYFDLNYYQDLINQ